MKKFESFLRVEMCLCSGETSFVFTLFYIYISAYFCIWWVISPYEESVSVLRLKTGLNVDKVGRYLFNALSQGHTLYV